MNRTFGLGVLGFVIGGGIMGLLEFRSDLVPNLMADQVAGQKDASGNTDEQPLATSAGDANLVTSPSSTPKQPRGDDSLPAAITAEPPSGTSAEKSGALPARSTSVLDETNSEDESGSWSELTPGSRHL